MGQYGRKVAILGAAARAPGRWAPKPNETAQGFEQDILAPLVIDALGQAGLSVEDVGSAAFTLPSPSTRQLGFATFMAARLGLKCTGSISEVVEMGITGGLAFDNAMADIALGRADVALALGIAYQTNAPFEMVMEHSLRTVGDVDFQSPFGLTPISWYAFDAARYTHETGVSREMIAEVAVKSRQHAQLNPLAQFQGDLSIDDVLAQRMIDAASGATSLGGRIPINTSGGCLSRGHPPSLTALYGLLELREQLLAAGGARQVKDAEIAMHACELGNYNAALIHILERAA
jgi:acetyl-CoA acetyltransferase